MKSVVLKPGKYSLQRERDSAGDSGPRLSSMKGPEGKELLYYDDLELVGENGEIRVGCRVECGSLTARSYSGQDFWLTTPVTEILEVNDDKTEVKFKTGNSTYIARSF